MDKGPAVPRLFAVLAGILFFGGFALFAYNWAETRVWVSGYIVLMVVAAVLSEHYAPVIGGHAASITLPLAIASMMLGGPCAGAIVASISAIRADSFESRRTRTISLFNFGQLALMYGTAGLIYVRQHGPILDGPGGMRHLVAGDFPAALVPMAVAVFSVTALNMIITGLGVSALYGRSFKDALAAVLPHGPSLVALGFVGYLIAQVVASNVIALPLFLFPLMLARQLYQRYAAMKGIYVDTVRSLIGALEAKDPYTRGHSVRVSEYAVRLGRRLGHDERTLDMLEKSALLHDIGKLALASSVLVKPSRLSDEEFAAMRLHPSLGADMVKKIPPLRGLTALVHDHHEWFDGAGYPSGLRQADIHPLARILSVADAFDAMTTTRAYRPAMDPEEAVIELYQGMGTQFDPSLVGPFVETLREEGGPLAAPVRTLSSPAVVRGEVTAS